MENKNSEKPIEQAKFNAGIAKLVRIDSLRKGCHEARLNHEWLKWKECLTGIRSELNERMDDNEKKISDGYELNIVKCHSENMRLIRKRLKPRYSVYYVLNRYELFLGTLEYKYGLSLPNKPGGLDAANE